MYDDDDDDIATHNSDGYSGQLLINMLNFLRIWCLRRAYVWGNLRNGGGGGNVHWGHSYLNKRQLGRSMYPQFKYTFTLTWLVLRRAPLLP